MPGVDTGTTGAAASGASSCAVAYPAATAVNTGKVDDVLEIFVGFTNNTGATPATPVGWTSGGAIYGGDGSAQGVDTGNRGAVVFWKYSTGSETGTVTVTNGGASGQVISAYMRRTSRAGTTWVTPAYLTDDDATVGTTLAIQPGSNFSGGGVSGDLLTVFGVWPNSGTNAGSIGSILSWGSGALGTTTISAGLTGNVTGGNRLRANTYQAPVIGPSTGNPQGNITAAAAGVGIIGLLRSTGIPTAAVAGSDQVGVEPGFPITVDGSQSNGSITAYDWEEDPLGTSSWSDVAGSSTDAVRTVTALATVAGYTHHFRLRVTDTSATTTAYDYVDVEVYGTTERFIDASGTVRAYLSRTVP